MTLVLYLARLLTTHRGPAYGPEIMRGRFWVGLFVLSFSVAKATSARADAAEVEALIAKANELRTQGNPWLALSYYRKAYDLSHTPRTVGQLGFGELAAGYPVEAAEHLTVSLRSPEHPWVAKYKDVIKDVLGKARARIGTLAVEGSPEGATVVLNGHDVGKLPLSSPISVAAGAVEVTVRAEDYAGFTRTIEMKGGGSEHLVVSLVRNADSLAPAPASRPKVAPEPSPQLAEVASPPAETVSKNTEQPASALRIPGFIAGGLGLAALVTGGVLQIVAERNIREFNRLCYIPDATPLSRDTDKPDLHCSDLHYLSESERKWSIGSYVAGGALAVTAGVLLLWSYHGGSDGAGQQHARVVCAPAFNGIACGGVF